MLQVNPPNSDPQNKDSMSVTPPVSHVEMWPYAASAAALSESQRATAVLMLSLSSALPATTSNKLTAHRSAAAPSSCVLLALGSVSNRASGPCGFAKHTRRPKHPPRGARLGRSPDASRGLQNQGAAKLETAPDESAGLGDAEGCPRRRTAAGEASKDSYT